MRLYYSPQAGCQLKGIKCHIIEKIKSPSAAKNVVLQIERACRILQDYPDIGFSFTSDDDAEEIGALPIGDYVALYKHDSENIMVVSIEDARSDWKSLYVLEEE